MKIIYVENVRIPSERAHAYQIIQTCAWFARLDNEVLLVNPDRAGDRDVFSFFGIEQGLFEHVRLPVMDPLSWKWFRLKKIAYLWQRFSFARALKKWAAGKTADVWYTRDPAMVDILQDASRRFVLELHDRPDAQPARWERIKPFVAQYVVITNGLADELVRLGIDRRLIHVAPDGYDPADFEHPGDCEMERTQLGVPTDAFVAMYTGSFYPWKGVDLVVRSWNQTDPMAHLVLVGGPEGDRKRVESLVPEDAASRVHILPSVDHAKSIRFLAAADVALLTTSDTQSIGRLYTSPLKQFEYLAAGLPIIASDVPSSHEILTDRVAMFFSLTEQGIAEAIKRAMQDISWRMSAGADAKTLVAPYTWQARTTAIVSHLLA
ncbi:MAG: glycosyltransferase [Patescibacteria group bacterium]